MKRQSTPRRLHMGCGEKLRGRVAWPRPDEHALNTRPSVREQPIPAAKVKR